MNVSQSNMISVPTISLTANLPTEEVDRANRIREKVPPSKAMAKLDKEKKLKDDDQSKRRAAYDPSLCPHYELEKEGKEEDYIYNQARSSEAKNHLEHMFKLLSYDTYNPKEGQSYTIRFRLPKKIVEDAVSGLFMEQRRVIIRYHYKGSVIPNSPSDVLAVL